MSVLKIGGHEIKNYGRPFIVAEAGINHNGNLDTALEMIRVAKDAGVNAVKFQTFKAEQFVGNHKQLYTYTSQGKKITESMLEMFKRYEFSEAQWHKIMDYCRSKKIMFLSTPQNPSDLKILLNLGVKAIKIGSDDLTNIPLLKIYSKTGLPLILSCGMADLGEIYHSLKSVGAFQGYPVILLLCTSEYPAPPEHVNLLRLKRLSQIFPNIPLGLSDHSEGTLASSLAVSFGASIIEKHFTLNKNFPGPDHWFSMDKSELEEWVNSIRLSYKIIGNGEIQPTLEEEEMKILARRSITAARHISKNEVLTDKNVCLKRPGNGLPPSFLENIIGLKAARNIKKDCLIQMGDFKK